MTWQTDRAYGRADVAYDWAVRKENVSDDVAAHVVQSGIDACQFVVGFKSATWPNHGLPRGAVLLVIWLCVKLFWRR